MNTSPCKRIVLAGTEGCRVSYCEDCHVAEIEIGAVSMRLEVHAFSNLSQMLQEAQARLAALNAARSAYECEGAIRHVH
jgi:hypothetical protein